MKRRQFITLLGGAVTALPTTVRTPQPPAKRIGVLMGPAENDPDPDAQPAEATADARDADLRG